MRRTAMRTRAPSTRWRITREASTRPSSEAATTCARRASAASMSTVGIGAARRQQRCQVPMAGDRRAGQLRLARGVGREAVPFVVEAGRQGLATSAEPVDRGGGRDEVGDPHDVHAGSVGRGLTTPLTAGLTVRRAGLATPPSGLTEVSPGSHPAGSSPMTFRIAPAQAHPHGHDHHHRTRRSVVRPRSRRSAGAEQEVELTLHHPSATAADLAEAVRPRGSEGTDTVVSQPAVIRIDGHPVPLGLPLRAGPLRRGSIVELDGARLTAMADHPVAGPAHHCCCGPWRGRTPAGSCSRCPRVRRWSVAVATPTCALEDPALARHQAVMEVDAGAPSR